LNALVKVLSCHLRSVSHNSNGNSTNRCQRHACYNGHAIIPLPLPLHLRRPHTANGATPNSI